MNQKQLSDILIGRKIVKIVYKDNNEDNLAIESIILDRGDVLSFDDKPSLSNPSYDEEVKGFYLALENIASNGIVEFKAEYLSNSFIEQEIVKKHRELKSNGYGQRPTSRQGYIRYRFDMPK